uniref:Nck-associated protein 5 C-terminal domain-containing protein n=1 Tax=Hippocampus comes TaxID=109280 RepID=A0A3Q2Z5N4_HIPCM
IWTSQTLLMSQKLNLRGDNKEGRMADATGQDHMMGSSCQMRTLDSGIGTFPLPDSVTRASGRHIPKCDSSADGVTAELQAEPPSPLPESSHPSVKMPSVPNTCLHAPGSLGHSFSDPSLTYSGYTPDAQTRLPKLTSESTPLITFHKHSGEQCKHLTLALTTSSLPFPLSHPFQ